MDHLLCGMVVCLLLPVGRFGLVDLVLCFPVKANLLYVSHSWSSMALIKSI